LHPKDCAFPRFIFILIKSPGCFSRFDVVKLPIGKKVACKKLVFTTQTKKGHDNEQTGKIFSHGFHVNF
jgi:hypothetical protein